MHPDREDSPSATSHSRPVLDVGSWSRFAPSLTHLLDTAERTTGIGTRAPAPVAPTVQESQSPTTVRLRAAAPIVYADTAAHRRPVRGPLRLLRRRRPSPSPLAPLLVVSSGDAGVWLTAPRLDDDGRALLGDDALNALTALGWRRRGRELVRHMADMGAAADMTVRVLIEVFDVAHPADLSVDIDSTGAAPPAT